VIIFRAITVMATGADGQGLGAFMRRPPPPTITTRWRCCEALLFIVILYKIQRDGQRSRVRLRTLSRGVRSLSIDSATGFS